MLPYVIEPQELAPRLGEPGLRLVDLCREEIWRSHHLPGAIHVEPRELVCGIPPATGKLPGRAQLAALLQRLQLSPDTRVVAYDDEGGGWAGRLLWTLDIVGHPHRSYLNGGLAAWCSENRPVSADQTPPPNDAPGPRPSDVTIDRTQLVTLEELRSRLGDPDLVLWDARSPEEYAGTRQHAARGGHIPGAVNLDWLETTDRARGKRIRHDIREVLSGKGIEAGKQIVTYCQTHHRSSLTYLIGKSLGLDIRGYDGSWSEWGNDPTTPVER